MKTQETVDSSKSKSEINEKESIIQGLKNQLNGKIEELEKVKLSLKELENENENLLKKSIIDIDPDDIEELKEMNKGLKRELLFKNSYVEELKLVIYKFTSISIYILVIQKKKKKNVYLNIEDNIKYFGSYCLKKYHNIGNKFIKRK